MAAKEKTNVDIKQGKANVVDSGSLRKVLNIFFLNQLWAESPFLSGESVTSRSPAA